MFIQKNIHFFVAVTQAILNMKISDKHTRRKVQCLNLLIAILILLSIVIDFSEVLVMELGASHIGLKSGLIEESTMQICAVKPNEAELSYLGNIPAVEIESDQVLYIPNKFSPHKLLWANTLLSFISLAFLLLLIIKLIQLTRSFTSDGLLHRRTIKRLRLLSFYMIGFELIGYISSFISAYYYRATLDLGNNHICYPELSASITMAFILLLLSEIANIAYKQREELELTI